MKPQLPHVKVFHARCLPMCLLALVAGLLFVSIDNPIATYSLVGVSAVVIAVLTLLAKRRKGVGIACMVCLLLSLVAVWQVHAISASLAAPSDSAVVEGRIAAVQTDEQGRITGVTIDTLVIEGEAHRGKAYVDLTSSALAEYTLVYAEALDPDYREGAVDVGQTVVVAGALKPIAVDYYTSYNMHRIARQTYYTLAAEAYATCTDVPVRKTAAETVRCALYANLHRYMSGFNSGMAYAFLTGDSSFVYEDVLMGYRHAGTAHLLAVSGLHVGILAGVLLWILRKTRCPAWARTVVLAAVLGLYAWVCSGTPSVIRAGVLAVGTSLSGALGVHRDKPSMLAMCALVLLCINPLWLFDVSFLLSYAAFAGAVLLYAPLRRLLGKLRGKWGDALALNLAVTVSTVPLSIYFFGGLSIFAVPFNFLLVPVMSVVYVLLLLLAVLSFIPYLGVLLLAVDYLLTGINLTVIYVGIIGYFSCSVAIWQLPVFYGGMALASPYCLVRPKVRYPVAVAMMAAGLLLAVLTRFVA